MRLLKGLIVGLAAVGLAAVGLAGCSGGGSPGPSAASLSPHVVTSTAPPPAPVSPQMRAGARAAAARFYGLYSASQFAAFWNLLSSATKNQISENTWVSVHDACPSAGAGMSRSIKAVTVFGTAAIVTEEIIGASHDTAEDVFSYANGRWSYSPADLSIYRHGSVTADIAAAKAAGLCASWKIF
jgi:hypothetical protein